MGAQPQRRSGERDRRRYDQNPKFQMRSPVPAASSPVRGPGLRDRREVRRRREAGPGAQPVPGRRWGPRLFAGLPVPGRFPGPRDTPPPPGAFSVPARARPQAPRSAFGVSQAGRSWNFGPPFQARSKAVYLLTSLHVLILNTVGRPSLSLASMPL